MHTNSRTCLLHQQEPTLEGNDMRTMLLALTFIVLFALTVPAFGAAPDFQAIMEGLQAKLDEASKEAWSAEVWSLVVPNPPESAGWGQRDPAFPGFDHTGNGINDDDHLALLQRVLDSDPVVLSVLGRPLVREIQEAFAACRERVMTREALLDYEILDSSRVNLRLFAVLNVRDRPLYAYRTRIRTGNSNTITVCVDSGLAITGTTCDEYKFNLPSIWGEKGILNGISDGLGDDIANLLSAYLTIGQQASVDYLQAMLYQLICQGILTADWEIEEEGEGNKAYRIPVVPDIVSDITHDPPKRTCLNALCTSYIEIIRFTSIVYGATLQSGIGRHFLNWFTVGANGFGAGYPALLGASGDFNGDGVSNAASYSNAELDRTLWFEAEGPVPGEEGELSEGEPPDEQPEGEDDPPVSSGGCLSGCGAKSFGSGNIHRILADWFILGLGLAVLCIVSGKRRF